MKFTEIEIVGLSEGSHSFDFQLDAKFLEKFSTDFFNQPKLNVHIMLDISETMIKADISIQGQVNLTCDRSLDEFEHLISLQVRHFFNFGENETELSDELEVISRDKLSIDFDQLIYDSVALSLPGKKLHPRFGDEDNESPEGQLIFSTKADNEAVENEEIIDPRWSKLKELNS